MSARRRRRRRRRRASAARHTRGGAEPRRFQVAETSVLPLARYSHVCVYVPDTRSEVLLATCPATLHLLSGTTARPPLPPVRWGLWGLWGLRGLRGLPVAMDEASRLASRHPCDRWVRTPFASGRSQNSQTGQEFRTEAVRRRPPRTGKWTGGLHTVGLVPTQVPSYPSFSGTSRCAAVEQIRI